MGELSDINEFIASSRAAGSERALGSLLGDLTREIGFDFYSLFRRAGPQYPSIAISDYPEAWLERVIGRRYYADDPVYVAARRMGVGFARAEIPTILPMTQRQQRILEEAGRAGLSDFFAVPAHVTGEECGIATFAVRDGRALPQRRLPMAQLAGTFAYEAARRLRRARGEDPQPDPVALTPRQIDCLLLIARGKTDWEIGRILGLREDTVGKYVEDARRRYDVSRRSQLVVRALFDGHFSLAEAMR